MLIMITINILDMLLDFIDRFFSHPSGGTGKNVIIQRSIIGKKIFWF